MRITKIRVKETQGLNLPGPNFCESEQVVLTEFSALNLIGCHFIAVWNTSTKCIRSMGVTYRVYFQVGGILSNEPPKYYFILRFYGKFYYTFHMYVPKFIHF
ncbi:hypothetical protein PPYR_02437 [Photinus pyralis]|uniref:Uncharacterized protein n=1 Tax=Photinus pyralis TaxID=7054 RepID=A0A5N4B787_PHOPY|nr:hypothetical protein PPYR_02437 [Photinus pyralis]